MWCQNLRNQDLERIPTLNYKYSEVTVTAKTKLGTKIPRLPQYRLGAGHLTHKLSTHPLTTCTHFYSWVKPKA